MLTSVLTILTTFTAVAWSQQIADATTLASLYSLTTSTSIPFPTATLSNSDAQSFIKKGWSLSKGKIQQGGGNIAFVADPFSNKSAPASTANLTGPVLQVKYPAGQVGSEASGMQLFSLWNTTDGSTFQSMLLTYEVAFDADFDFVKGGKLPGLRGGPDPDGCSGGSAANGSNCFSSRLMWRKAAAGEGTSYSCLSLHGLSPLHQISILSLPIAHYCVVSCWHIGNDMSRADTCWCLVYAYIPTPNNICSNSDFRCNSDGFGTSIDRGSFSFVPGQCV